MGMEISVPKPGAGGKDAAAWVPVDACTLPTADQPLRLAEFDDLFTDALNTVEGDGAQRARLLLAGDATLPGRVRRLVDAESSCCSFITFTVTSSEPHPAAGPGKTSVALTIEVPAARAEVLAALVTRAERARRVVS
jgi:hypothetical protein